VAIRASNPNHFAVYVGENKLIHHPLLQLSREEPWRDFWRMTTCYVLRHPAVPVLTSALPETTIKDLVSARYSPQAEA
jgi:cell wall-associated NlpC family hydrolase